MQGQIQQTCFHVDFTKLGEVVQPPIVSTTQQFWLYAAQQLATMLMPVAIDVDQLLVDVFVHARFVFLFIPWLTCNSEDRNSPSNVLAPISAGEWLGPGRRLKVSIVCIKGFLFNRMRYSSSQSKTSVCCINHHFVTNVIQSPSYILHY
jgi:hypothetical protein